MLRWLCRQTHSRSPQQNVVKLGMQATNRRGTSAGSAGAALRSSRSSSSTLAAKASCSKIQYVYHQQEKLFY